MPHGIKPRKTGAAMPMAKHRRKKRPEFFVCWFSVHFCRQPQPPPHSRKGRRINYGKSASLGTLPLRGPISPNLALSEPA